MYTPVTPLVGYATTRTGCIRDFPDAAGCVIVAIATDAGAVAAGVVAATALSSALAAAASKLLAVA